MNNNLMRDETRERFENTHFPDNLSPVYLGTMANNSSLGRYALGVSSLTLPLQIKTVDIVPKSFEDMGFWPEEAEIRSRACAYDFQIQFELKEKIAAYVIEYGFFNIWGNSVGGFKSEQIQDIAGDKLTVSECLAYDFSDPRIQQGLVGQAEVIEGLNPYNFHICVFGITHCRTVDGGYYESPSEEVMTVINWAIPRQ